MAIVNTIDNATQFASEFIDVRPNDFTRAALESLYELLEDTSEATGENIEFDPVAICCDFEEYDVDELREEFSGCAEIYNDEMNEHQDDEDAKQAVMEHARDAGGMITAADTVVIHCADTAEL